SAGSRRSATRATSTWNTRSIPTIRCRGCSGRSPTCVGCWRGSPPPAARAARRIGDRLMADPPCRPAPGRYEPRVTAGGEMPDQQRLHSTRAKTEIPRREFLKSTAAGAAGFALASMPAVSYARILGANDRVRVGIVGYSDRFRQAHLPVYATVGKELNFEIVAVSDIWNRRRDEGAAEIAKATG